mmetsp:Transcript_1413/g.5474  ORF Transcript_1413/g.5474 Transcript_1413/m.5474 type:complete len:458 (+) Transcript_1413:92-1465(+)
MMRVDSTNAPEEDTRGGCSSSSSSSTNGDTTLVAFCTGGGAFSVVVLEYKVDALGDGGAEVARGRPSDAVARGDPDEVVVEVAGEVGLRDGGQRVVERLGVEAAREHRDDAPLERVLDRVVARGLDLPRRPARLAVAGHAARRAGLDVGDLGHRGPYQRRPDPRPERQAERRDRGRLGAGGREDRVVQQDEQGRQCRERERAFVDARRHRRDVDVKVGRLPLEQRPRGLQEARAERRERALDEERPPRVGGGCFARRGVELRRREVVDVDVQVRVVRVLVVREDVLRHPDEDVEEDGVRGELEPVVDGGRPRERAVRRVVAGVGREEPVREGQEQRRDAVAARPAGPARGREGRGDDDARPVRRRRLGVATRAVGEQLAGGVAEVVAQRAVDAGHRLFGDGFEGRFGWGGGQEPKRSRLVDVLERRQPRERRACGGGVAVDRVEQRRHVVACCSGPR